MSSRELPAHIANLLQRQGATSGAESDAFTEEVNQPSSQQAQQQDHQHSAGAYPPATDSAGIPWQGRDLSGGGNPLHSFDGDNGLTPDDVAAAEENLLVGEIDEAQFVATLARQRLFVPVIASLGEGSPGASADGPAEDSADALTGGHDADDVAATGDKEADISLVTLSAPDGRAAMPVFTSVEAMTAWHSEARPVAAETERIMLAALAEGAELVVLNPGAEVTFVVRRPAVEALAQGSVWTPSYQDAELAEMLAEVPLAAPGVAQLQVGPHAGVATQTASGAAMMGGGHGPELHINVVCEPELDRVGQRLALAAVQTELGEITALTQRADSVHVSLAQGEKPEA